MVLNLDFRDIQAEESLPKFGSTSFAENASPPGVFNGTIAYFITLLSYIMPKGAYKVHLNCVCLYVCILYVCLYM